MEVKSLDVGLYGLCLGLSKKDEDDELVDMLFGAWLFSIQGL